MHLPHGVFVKMSNMNVFRSEIKCKTALNLRCHLFLAVQTRLIFELVFAIRKKTVLAGFQPRAKINFHAKNFVIALIAGQHKKVQYFRIISSGSYKIPMIAPSTEVIGPLYTLYTNCLCIAAE